MLEWLNLWGMNGIYALVFIIGALFLGQGFGLWKIPLIGDLASTKRGSYGVAAILMIGAAVMGGATFMQGLGITQDEAQPAQILEFNEPTGSTHVTEVQDEDTVLVRYKENTSSGNALFAGDDSELDTVGFTAPVFNSDEDNDKGAKIVSVNGQVENSDSTNSPWDIIVKRSDETDNVALTPSGGSLSYGDASFLVSNFSSKDVTVNLEPNDTALGNIELYDSATVELELQNASGAIQDTLTVELQKTGEVS